MVDETNRFVALTTSKTSRRQFLRQVAVLGGAGLVGLGGERVSALLAPMVEEKSAGKHDYKTIKEEVRKFFETASEEVFYMQQLQVKFEKKYFHWLVDKAVKELIAAGDLKTEMVPLSKGTRVRFVFNRQFRYYKRQINRAMKVIRKYATPKTATACGRQAEMLFFNALTNQRFVSHGQDINAYNEKKWTESDHNLDFIIERDGIVYGCEVKNKLCYIDRKEMGIKLRICEWLGIRPLFILRYAPKSYINEINKRGGYAMLYETQIYPYAQDGLVDTIRDNLGLPVDCPRVIPGSIIERFLKWHNKQIKGGIV